MDSNPHCGSRRCLGANRCKEYFTGVLRKLGRRRIVASVAAPAAASARSRYAADRAGHPRRVATAAATAAAAAAAESTGGAAVGPKLVFEGEDGGEARALVTGVRLQFYVQRLAGRDDDDAVQRAAVLGDDRRRRVGTVSHDDRIRTAGTAAEGGK